MRHFILHCATLAIASGALHAKSDPVPVDISATLESIRAKHKVPGLVAVVLRGDEIIAQGAAGVRKNGSPEAVTLVDRFHLGSDTKAMTATVLAMLVEEGKVKWTSTLGEIFGGSVKAMRPEWKDVTLQQVLAHRAGLPAGPAVPLTLRLNAGSKPLPEQRAEVVAAALAEKPEFPAGEKFLYSNTGFILVGAVIEKITGRSWEDVIREKLFQPLGMASAGFGAPSVSGKLDQPWGHEAGGKAVAADFDNPAFFGPAGTAHMAVGDWAKFIALHLRGDPANPHAHANLLKAETFAALHTPVPGESYVAGWGIAPRPWAKGVQPSDTGRALTHSGSNTAWFCSTWVAPEIDFAVLIACNEGGDAIFGATDEIAGTMIRKFARGAQ